MQLLFELFSTVVITYRYIYLTCTKSPSKAHKLLFLVKWIIAAIAVIAAIADVEKDVASSSSEEVISSGPF